jgi:tRNA pseudouridine55 synthase
MDGILNLNKPTGSTSFAMVAMVRRLSKQRRVGHAGTLDPIAGGVLPVCLGRATRVVEFLLEESKVYRAQIELGKSTDSHDASGNITAEADCSAVSRHQLEQALDSFRGDIRQTPPMYSALKHNGQRLYRLAREGVTVERGSRPAHIYRLELVDFQPPLATLEIECSRGTYIRSLAHDLGQTLGCGAHIKELVRTKYGPFSIEDAISPAELEQADDKDWQGWLHPVDYVLKHWASVMVDEEQEQLIKHGSSITFAQGIPEKRCRAYSQDGSFLAVLYYDEASGRWQPQKVFA